MDSNMTNRNKRTIEESQETDVYFDGKSFLNLPWYSYHEE